MFFMLRLFSCYYQSQEDPGGKNVHFEDAVYNKLALTGLYFKFKFKLYLPTTEVEFSLSIEKTAFKLEEKI